MARLGLILPLTLFASTLAALAKPGEPPDGAGPLLLMPDVLLQVEGVVESSGLIASPRNKGILYTHNDSGGEPALYPLTTAGVRPQGRASGLASAIRVTGARNRDWEDLARDGSGGLVIGDFGNNGNRRRDLSLYRVDEPDPLTDAKTAPARRIAFYYPEQQAFPPAERAQWAWDCEAFFVRDGHAWLITKHAAGGPAHLYAVDLEASEEPAAARRIQSLDLQGRATAADISADGRHVYILTYGGIWRFERGDDNTLSGGRRLPIVALQCEALACLPDGRIAITNEQNGLYLLDASIFD